MRYVWIFVLLMSMVFSGCSQDAEISDVTSHEEETSPATSTFNEPTSTVETNTLIQNEGKNEALVDIIGEETKVHQYIMPNSKEMVFEELEPTYEGNERLQITYSVAINYKDALAYYQELTGRPEADYTNAYGYFFDDIFLGDGDDYIEQILVQDQFNRTEIVMIIQNTSRHASNTGNASEDETERAEVNLDSYQTDFENSDTLPQFENEPSRAAVTSGEFGRISIDYLKEGLSLWQSAQHSGFESFEGHYLEKEFDWQNYSGEETWSSLDSTKKVWLREDFMTEEHIIDDMNTKYTYYDPYQEIYYEVSEFVADANEESDDGKILVGNMIYLPGIEDEIFISYNPFVVPTHIRVVDCYFTELFDQTMLYVLKEDEKNTNHKWTKQWISLDYGVVVKQEVYSDDSKLIKLSILQKATFDEIPYYVFMPRQDVVYKDLTLDLFFRDNHFSKDFSEGFQQTFMQGFFDIDLIDEKNSEAIQLTFDGNRMETMAERRIVKNMNEEEIELISFREGNAFKVAVPSKEEIYLYPSSINEHQWFQFNSLGFRERSETDQEIIYTFEKNDQGNISGFVNRYDYVINKTTNKFDKIIMYAKDPMTSYVDRSDEIVFSVRNLRSSSDEVFTRVSSYKENFIFAHDDGESYPPWWE